jgi:membrane protease YdiL (CAAX protease family)
MYWPYVWLGLAICAVWLPSLPWRGRAVPPWTLLFLAAVAAAYGEGLLDVRGLAVIAVFAAVTWGSLRAPHAAARTALTLLAALIMLALPARALPGFHQPYPSTGFARSFGLGTGGLFLLAAYAPRMRSWQEARQLARPALRIIGGTVVGVLAVAWAVGHIRVDPKWPAIAPAHLAANLLFVCVAEEAFFRGLLQDRLARVLQRWPRGHWLALALASVLFGLAHLGKGPVMAGLATLAGVGYGLAYARTGRIEPAVLAHFAVNGVNYLAFSYTSA